MRNLGELKVFELADRLAEDVYRLTVLFPKEERFGLTQQLRRAAVSVPSNLVEGCSRESQADFRRFVEIALGSAMEARYQVGFAYRLSRDETLHFNVSASAWSDVMERAEALVRALSALGKSLRG